MVKLGFRVMDSDIHVMEPLDLWVQYIEPKFKDNAPQVDPNTGRLHSLGRPIPAYSDRQDRERVLRVRREHSNERFAASGRVPTGGAETMLQRGSFFSAHESGGEVEGSYPASMLEALEIEGIDVAVCFRTLAAHVIAMDDMDPKLSAAICRAFNNWLRVYCDAEPKRLQLGAQIPIHDVNLAVAESHRCVTELGAVTLVLPSNQICGRTWYDEYYEPFWTEAEKLGVPVSFHGIHLAYQEHLARRYMDNHALGHAVAHPVEMMCTLGSLLIGGVFERHPGLKVAFLEANCSWVPWWLYSLDEHEEKMGDKERFGLKLAPSEYFRRQCYVSVDPDEKLVRYAIESIGDDNLVFSTDWPHDDSSYPNATQTLLELDGVSVDSKRKILWDNCARLYGLD